MTEIVLFALFATTACGTALGVILIRDPVKAAMSLIGCFFSIACLFLLQRAELIAVLQVLVYAGAIMVLFVFVIMLVERRDEAIVASTLGQRAFVPIKIAAVALVAYGMISLVRRAPIAGSADLAKDFGTVKVVGREFFGSFLFQFEFTSVLLLVAIVGAVMISKRHPQSEAHSHPRPPPPPPPPQQQPPPHPKGGEDL